MPGTRCVQCSALLRPGAPWCTQCYAALGAPVPVVPRQERRPETAPPSLARPAPPVPPPAAPAGAAWPCDSCAHANPLDADVCAACGTPFLAAAREGEPALVLPVVGDLATLSTVRRFGAALALVAVLLLVAALLGLLLS